MKISVNKNKVGLRINQFRTNRGYTLREFGVFFGASDSIVSRWEKGVALPNKERLVKMSKLMGLTLNELLYGSVEEFIKENYLTLIAFGVTVETRKGRKINAIDALCPLGKYLEFYNNKKEEYNKNLNLKSSNTIDNIDYFSQKYNINSIDELLGVLREYFFDFYSSQAFSDDNTEPNPVQKWMVYEVDAMEKAKAIDDGVIFTNSVLKLFNSIDTNSQINIIEQMIQHSNLKEFSDFDEWINNIINQENK